MRRARTAQIDVSFAAVGQRSATETLFGIVAAFVERSTWSQAELARRLETTTETIRKRLGDLQAGGFKLERDEDHPHVYWSVPKNWFPGVLPFKADEVPDLIRLLGRVKPSELRDKILDIVVSRLSNVGHPVPDDITRDLGRDRERDDDDEERWLSVVEDARQKKNALRMRYFSASRGREGKRYVSVHAIEHGVHPHFIATCHTANALRRFRVSNISDARIDLTEAFRPVPADEVTRFQAESFGGFREAGPLVHCAFVVRDPESVWVAKNLPDHRITAEAAPGGTRFSIDTTAVVVLARFVVGLGDAARAETPELAQNVIAIAEGALKSAREAPFSSRVTRA
jgi:predicted DNA-binding transcriptional regulator YafY